MNAHSVHRVAALIALAPFIGCGGSSSTEPTAFDPPGTHQAALSGVGWSGAGGVSVTPFAATGGIFTADFKVRLRNAKPSTTYFVQRAPDVGRAASNDGVCQRGLNVSPWSSADPPAASYITFPRPDGTPVSLVTSATGDGSVDFTFSVATIPAGTRFDVMFRVLDDVTLPRSVLLSDCITVLAL